MSDPICVVPVRTINDLRAYRESIIAQRDVAMQNYHRCCGALDSLDIMINDAVAAAARELQKKAAEETAKAVKDAKMVDVPPEVVAVPEPF